MKILKTFLKDKYYILFVHFFYIFKKVNSILKRQKDDSEITKMAQSYLSYIFAMYSIIPTIILTRVYHIGNIFLLLFISLIIFYIVMYMNNKLFSTKERYKKILILYSKENGKYKYAVLFSLVTLIILLAFTFIKK